MLNFFNPAAFDDAVAGDGGAGERDRAHVGVRAQRLAGLRAGAVDDVQHAGRDAGFERQFAQPRGAQR